MVNSVLGEHTTLLNMETVSMIQIYQILLGRLDDYHWHLSMMRHNYAINPYMYRKYEIDLKEENISYIWQ